MNYTEPRVVLTPTLEKRSYITFKYEGRRLREYTGRAIGIQISPNRATSLTERNYLMELLCNHFKEALAIGDYIPPDQATKAIKSDEPLLGELRHTLMLALENKRKQKLAPRYIKHLERLLYDFLEFIPEREHTMNISRLSQMRLTSFLEQYGQSATYYMCKRRHLKVLLSEAERITKLVIPATRSLPRRKPKPRAHEPYSAEQLTEVFSYLKVYDPQLYVCTVICYGCWLRPHNEVRRLRRRNFKEDCTKIVLDADKNKSGRIRSVRVPEQVAAALEKMLEGLEPEDNIFTRAEYEYTEDYFSRRWQRARKVMLKKGIINQGHTIYSFRHTAAIDLYQRTKDVALLQRIMDHAEISTTMTYLRGLGELNETDWQIVVPTNMNF